MNLASRAAFALLLAISAASAAQTYTVTQHWKVGGTGGWDYLSVDSAAHRLYISHNARVEVLDTRTGAPAGAVTGLSSVHGIAFDPASNLGFISDGAANSVVIFDRTDLSVKAKIAVGTNPDTIIFEPATKTVWAFNGRSKNISVIDPVAKSVIATIPLPGRPEFATADGKGSVFVNLEDGNSIVKLDAAKHTANAPWPLPGCESPSGMAIDRAGKRLFSVCDGKKMAIVDYQTGKLLGLASIGDGPDAAGFDPKHKLAFSSNGEGTVSVVDTTKPGFPTVQTVKTAKGARTMAFDEATGNIYLSAAQYGPAPAPTAEHPRPRPSVLPNSFEIIVVSAAK